MPAHVGAGVPANINKHRGLSPRGYDFAEAERVLYDAYGRQTVLANNGVVAYKPSDYGQFVGFTGRYHDWETGLEYFRARYFDLTLGRFIGRDPAGYVDGTSLYSGYFVPNGVDPSGLWDEAGHFYTGYGAAITAGVEQGMAEDLAYWIQFTDEVKDFDAMATKDLGIRAALHSLTGGDAAKRRAFLSCLFKNENLTLAQKGALIHAIGDTFAHSYVDKDKDGNEIMRLYEADKGHATAGHAPDFIHGNLAKYKTYLSYIEDLISADKGLSTGSRDNSLHQRMVDAANEINNRPIELGSTYQAWMPWEVAQDMHESAVMYRATKYILNSKHQYFPETNSGKYLLRNDMDNAAGIREVNALVEIIKKGTKKCKTCDYEGM